MPPYRPTDPDRTVVSGPLHRQSRLAPVSSRGPARRVVPTAQRWAGRCRENGTAGVQNRSSRPRHSPNRLDARAERRILGLGVSRRRRGPERIADRLRLNPSTVHKVLARHQAPTLAWTDPATDARLRAKPKPPRYGHEAPGDLVHMDVKKLGRLPDGGGHRVHGRAKGVLVKKGAKLEMARVHNAVADHSRLA